ncbi:hypothetical protein ACLB90_00865 [Stenotrophomonas sp. LGBM10]|uniref:hypothetical protein n=1 Tax=Stenotrophomonas sp. LGBM10 TaxID=3390038 RepID=UPI00398A7DD5
MPVVPELRLPLQATLLTLGVLLAGTLWQGYPLLLSLLGERPALPPQWWEGRMVHLVERGAEPLLLAWLIGILLTQHYGTAGLHHRWRAGLAFVGTLIVGHAAGLAISELLQSSRPLAPVLVHGGELLGWAGLLATAMLAARQVGRPRGAPGRIDTRIGVVAVFGPACLLAMWSGWTFLQVSLMDLPLISYVPAQVPLPIRVAMPMLLIAIAVVGSLGVWDGLDGTLAPVPPSRSAAAALLACTAALALLTPLAGLVALVAATAERPWLNLLTAAAVIALSLLVQYLLARWLARPLLLARRPLRPQARARA